VIIRMRRKDLPVLSGKGGQSLIETCLMMGLVCLLFFGLFQVSQLFAAREILYHAAARGARARTVGLNDWMVQKAVMVASIPNAGRMIVPEPDTEADNQDAVWAEMVAEDKPGTVFLKSIGVATASAQYNIERARIPEFMASDNANRARQILDYARWDNIRFTVPDAGSFVGGVAPMIDVDVSQVVSNWVPMHKTFYVDDNVELHGKAVIEDHSALYLE
jgi:hypothetical protein